MNKSVNKYEDADELFKKHTIKEILEIQKKIKNDIERKKEDLRHLVGEKYHNLIEAADTIREMRTSVEHVTSHIHLLEDTNTGFSSQIGRDAAVPQVCGHTPDRCYAIAAEIKILADIPSKLWFLLDTEDLLSAGKLYLVAQHVHTMLLLNEGSVTLNERFPFVEQQWSGISRFHKLILQQCRTAIQQSSTPYDKISEALCCMMLLEGLTVKDVFLELLNLRFSAVQGVFGSIHPGVSVKMQVCELVVLIQNTIYAVYLCIFDEIISPGQGGSGIKHCCRLLSIVDQIQHGKDERPAELAKTISQHVYSYLPPNIINFRCKFKVVASPILHKELQETCRDWVDRVNKSVQCDLGELLKYVNTVKGISQIRDSVMQLHVQVEQWESMCGCVLGKPFSVWNTVLRYAFVSRVKDMMGRSLTDSFQKMRDCVTLCLDEMNGGDAIDIMASECNVLLYTWNESAKDLPSNIRSLFHGRKSLWDRGSLGMKAWCFTPKVQNICKVLDQNLQSMLLDVSYYTYMSSGEGGENDRSSSSKMAAMEKFPMLDSDVQDITDVYRHIGTTVKACLSEFRAFVSECLHDKDGSRKKDRKWQMILLGRFCEALLQLCPHLYRCVSLNTIAELGDGNQLPKSLFLGVEGFKLKSNPHWDTIKKDLQACTKDAYRNWLQDVAESAVRRFESNMIEPSDAGMLKTMMQWDERNIEEEADEGRVITSTIRVPFQISLPLYCFLHDLCAEINRAVGHAFQPSLAGEITLDVFEKVVECYAKAAAALKSVSSDKLAQTRALQCLFDVHYLNGMFGAKDEAGRRVQVALDSVISELEMCIDPFDLDVFTPHVQLNLASARHGTSLLFGLLMPAEWSTRYRAPYTSSNQDVHNLLLHTSVASRFPLLPVTSNRNTNASGKKSSVPEIRGEAKMLESLSHEVHHTAVRSQSSSNLEATHHQASGVNKSASFYDRMTAMSSSWFGSS